MAGPRRPASPSRGGVIPAIILSAAAMTAIVALRYLATSGLFAALTRHRFPDRLAGRATRGLESKAPLDGEAPGKR